MPTDGSGVSIKYWALRFALLVLSLTALLSGHHMEAAVLMVAVGTYHVAEELRRMRG